MSHPLISHNPDLRRLRDEGYSVEVSGSSYLLVHDVPYVNSHREIAYGTLASELTLTGDKTIRPSNHVVLFIGDFPCLQDGKEINQIRHSASNELVAPLLRARFSFSNKPKSGYNDYYEKMSRYADIISYPAMSIDPKVTAKVFRAIEASGEDSVFKYIDTASSRAGISEVSEKLKLGRIAIIGLGGTGSYVLDLVAKTPVNEIHLFDGDKFIQHNAFRSPGAPSLDDLSKAPMKVDYYASVYSRMRNNIIPHGCFLDALNLELLEGFDFVFICMDTGFAKKDIVLKLLELGIPFVDTGMGIQLLAEEQSLIGILRVTTATNEKTDHLMRKISFVDTVVEDDYSRNIQLAELNALSAALAVVKWKKLYGFYHDMEKEHDSTYSINVNMLTSEDKSNEEAGNLEA